MQITAATIPNNSNFQNYFIRHFKKFQISIGSLENANYVVAVFKSYLQLNDFLKSSDIQNKKIVVLLPLNIFNGNFFKSKKLPSNIAVGYYQEATIPLNNMEVGVGEIFYYSNLSDIAKTVVRWLLAFGPFGQESFILGSQTSSATVWKEFKKYNPNLELNYNKSKLFVKIPKGYPVIRLNTNLSKLVKSLFLTKIEKIKTKPKLSIPKINLRKFKLPIVILSLIILIPTFCLIIVTTFFYLSYKSFLLGKISMSRNLLLVSKTPAAIGSISSVFISKDLVYVFNSLNGIADMGVTALKVVDSGQILLGKVMGDQIYDPVNLTKSMSDDLTILSREFTEFEHLTTTNADNGVIIAKKVVDKVNFQKYHKQLEGAAKIMRGMPNLLGYDFRKTYLLLFQNNMELRPTGGFIGSFGLLTMDGGRMADLSVSDVYSADGQLKGHVEPPEAIREHLGEANWYLRDSNWDPDFVVSAQKAEWFLNKEIDKKVDGVIALDLNVAADILRYTGPIYLVDYNMDITADNLYLKTQEEVHRDFFPGTHKKASFLTALSRNLVTEVMKLDNKGKVSILKELYQNLEERHIQLALHDTQIQEIIGELMWSGEVKVPSCGEDCYADFVSVVEANVGVNKANYFVERSYKLETKLIGNEIRRQLTLSFKNNASPSLELAGKYKVYIRINTKEGEKDFLEEILNGQSKDLTYSWVSSTDKSSNYGIYFRKQAGILDNSPLVVSIIAPQKIYSYNTNLNQDFLTKIPWTNIH